MAGAEPTGTVTIVTNDAPDAATAALGGGAKVTGAIDVGGAAVVDTGDGAKVEEKPAETGAAPQKAEGEQPPDGAEGDDGDGDEGGEQPGADGKPSRPSRGFKRKLEITREELGLTVRERDMEREARQRAEAELDRLRRGDPRTDAPPKRDAAPADADAPPAIPDISDFENEADYRKAMGAYAQAVTDFAVRKALSKVEERARISSAEDAAKRESEKLRASCDESRKVHQDYDQVVGEAREYLQRRGIDLTEAIERCIVDSDAGGELLYALAQDPRELARLCALRPLAAAREIGRLEGRLVAARPDSSGATKPNPQRPQPRAPIEPPRGGSGAVVDPQNFRTQAEYDAWRDKGGGRS